MSEVKKFFQVKIENCFKWYELLCDIYFRNKILDETMETEKSNFITP